MVNYRVARSELDVASQTTDRVGGNVQLNTTRARGRNLTRANQLEDAKVLDAATSTESTRPCLRVILKADVAGSEEAICQQLAMISQVGDYER